MQMFVIPYLKILIYPTAVLHVHVDQCIATYLYILSFDIDVHIKEGTRKRKLSESLQRYLYYSI